MEKRERRKTVLHPWHQAAGGRMGEFAGYEMPLWYPAGAATEHVTVLERAGLFDTSHMSVLEVRGPDSLDLLQFCFTKDLLRSQPAGGGALNVGRSAYGAFLDEQGNSIDDAIVFRRGEDCFLVVVNVGMGQRVSAHLEAYRRSRKVEIEDYSGRIGKIDLQGPQSARILVRLLSEAQRVLSGLVYFAFAGDFRDPQSGPGGEVRLRDGTPLLLSRTGYTGEFGFEIFVALERTETVWKALLEAGRPFGLLPCGLAARDSLRTGAVLPLSGQDIGPWPFIRHPWEFALPFDARKEAFTKMFVGSGALLEGRERAWWTYPFVGRDVRKVADRGRSVVLDARGEEIGSVTSCTTDRAIGWHGGRIVNASRPERPAGFSTAGLACGFLRARKPLRAGEVVQLRDQRRTIEVVIVEDIRPGRTARRPMGEMLS